MSDLLSHLKRGTADKHTALENALALMRPAISRDEYVALLSGFRGFVAPWEQALAAVLPADLQEFAKAREKTALLDEDLVFLTGGKVDPLALPVVSLREVGLEISSMASALGSMYVMEGSTLGGRFIAPAMAKRFGLDSGQGYRYFDPYGAHTGSMWNAFKEMAAARLTPEQHDEALTAARATFDALFAWLPHVDQTADQSAAQSAAQSAPRPVGHAADRKASVSTLPEGRQVSRPSEVPVASYRVVGRKAV